MVIARALGRLMFDVRARRQPRRDRPARDPHAARLGHPLGGDLHGRRRAARRTCARPTRRSGSARTCRSTRSSRRRGRRRAAPGLRLPVGERGASRGRAREAGVVFVGPSPDAIELMGDKVRAKEAAASRGRAGRGVPERRGGADVGRVPAAGQGRGGRRRARDARRGVAPTGSTRRSPPRSARPRPGFGDDRVFIERFLPRARHIEVQVIGDTHGTVLSLGERECSLQRRHQKVLEESPSPVVVAGAARDARPRGGRAGAGRGLRRRRARSSSSPTPTIPRTHFFLEMNARLQVEHPVTELVTGLDLVELQLRVAAGEPLDARGRSCSGHAIEARVNAEDARVLPVRRAGPARALPGRACASTRRSRPARVVGTDYDSMIAKVIAHGPDRATALARLDRALADTAILGLETNVGFLRSLLAREDVRAGEMDTGLIGRLDAADAAAERRGGRPRGGRDRADARRRARGDDPFERRDGWRLGRRARAVLLALVGQRRRAARRRAARVREADLADRFRVGAALRRRARVARLRRAGRGR